MKNIYIQFDTFIIAYIFHVFLLQCIKFTKAFFLKEIEQKKKKKKINRNNCNKSNRMHINLKNEKEINNSFDISYGQFMCSLCKTCTNHSYLLFRYNTFLLERTEGFQLKVSNNQISVIFFPYPSSPLLSQSFPNFFNECLFQNQTTIVGLDPNFQSNFISR